MHLFVNYKSNLLFVVLNACFLARYLRRTQIRMKWQEIIVGTNHSLLRKRWP